MPGIRRPRRWVIRSGLDRPVGVQTEVSGEMVVVPAVPEMRYDSVATQACGERGRSVSPSASAVGGGGGGSSSFRQGGYPCHAYRWGSNAWCLDQESMNQLPNPLQVNPLVVNPLMIDPC